jgi:predicted metal-dependent HD superfamily phosphohydrolase
VSAVTAASPERWAKLWREIGAKDNRETVYQELVSFYSEPHRHYHNLQHIADFLTEFDSTRNLAQRPLAVELAIWFHDAIYNARASDNEEKSAELAKRRISEAGGSNELSDAVAALVMATKSHDASSHPDAPLMVDIDLSILGQPEERFWKYESQIRGEYDWVPEAIFAAKRTEILERFLARERIYSTNHFFDLYEQQARAHLQASVQNLKSRPWYKKIL